MGNTQGGPGKGGGKGGDGKDKKDEKKKRYEPPQSFGRKGKKKKGASGTETLKVPAIAPNAKCRLRLLKQERLKDYLMMEEEYVANQEALKPKEDSAENEERNKLDELRGTPMDVGTLEEFIDENHVIVSTATGPEWYVNLLSFVDTNQLEPGSTILMHHRQYSVIGILGDDVDPLVNVMKVDKAPLESYADIGGLEEQIMEMKEAPELYEDVGIKPPKGVILWGPPGTGKTFAREGSSERDLSDVLRIVGSELIQKYLGDGPKLVREMFRVAAEHAPSIIFMDEIDAVATKRYDTTSGGEKEIQRTLLELLNQLDGFDDRGEVKVIMATNRIDTLDPALIRPGRIDRKIEFPAPDEKTKRRIFHIHTSKMTLHDDVNIEEFVLAKDDLSGADVKAICMEAGMLALRERRMKITQADLRKAKEKALYKKKGNVPDGMYL